MWRSVPALHTANTLAGHDFNRRVSCTKHGTKGQDARWLLQGDVSHYAFVSSAGTYVAGKVQPEHVEGDPRKASAGHVEVEEYLKSEVQLLAMPATTLLLRVIWSAVSNRVST